LTTFAQDIIAAEKKVGLFFDPIHLILVGFLIVALLSGVYLFESKRAEIAEAKAEVATQAAKAAQEAANASEAQNKTLQEQAEATEAAQAAANAKLEAANEQLLAANKQLLSTLAAQQQKDAALSPSAQAQRWEALVPSAEVTTTSSGFSVDSAGGLSTIQDLEELPLDRQEISNLNQELSNETKIANDNEVSLKAEQAAHLSDIENDKKQLIAEQDNTKAVQAQFNAYKKKAHRNLIRAFFAGVIAGVIGGHAAGL